MRPSQNSNANSIINAREPSVAVQFGTKRGSIWLKYE
jgi:hypothetical protein